MIMHQFTRIAMTSTKVRFVRKNLMKKKFTCFGVKKIKIISKLKKILNILILKNIYKLY